jgi:hypothetical protein
MLSPLLSILRPMLTFACYHSTEPSPSNSYACPVPPSFPFPCSSQTDLPRPLPFPSQQASARTASGNLDLPEPSSNYSDVLYSVFVNNQTSSPLEWLIPYNASSSCSQRSGIACYNLRHQFEFPAGWLGEWNTFRLALPYNAS